MSHHTTPNSHSSHSGMSSEEKKGLYTLEAKLDKVRARMAKLNEAIAKANKGSNHSSSASTTRKRTVNTVSKEIEELREKEHELEQMIADAEKALKEYEELRAESEEEALRKGAAPATGRRNAVASAYHKKAEQIRKDKGELSRKVGPLQTKLKEVREKIEKKTEIMSKLPTGPLASSKSKSSASVSANNLRKERAALEESMKTYESSIKRRNERAAAASMKKVEKNTKKRNSTQRKIDEIRKKMTTAELEELCRQVQSNRVHNSSYYGNNNSNHSVYASPSPIRKRSPTRKQRSPSRSPRASASSASASQYNNVNVL